MIDRYREKLSAARAVRHESSGRNDRFRVTVIDFDLHQLYAVQDSVASARLLTFRYGQLRACIW